MKRHCSRKANFIETDKNLTHDSKVWLHTFLNPDQTAKFNEKKKKKRRLFEEQRQFQKQR